ncbi:MAG: hypothetical protein IPJ04_08315 [Candidatus Eisenbacteria bacterium]|nr:hypothetical protein [Candidatus Eisenbacteria bacterium]
MRDSIAAALASGALPDLCVLDSTAMPALLERGDLSDWSAGVADLRDSLTGWGFARWAMRSTALGRLRELGVHRAIRDAVEAAPGIAGLGASDE